MSNELKTSLISAGNTFLATFLATVGASVASGNLEWTTAFWLAIGTSAVRAGVKAVISRFVPVNLGGKKA